MKCVSGEGEKTLKHICFLNASITKNLGIGGCEMGGGCNAKQSFYLLVKTHQ